jgi:hypothetical protein
MSCSVSLVSKRGCSSPSRDLSKLIGSRRGCWVVFLLSFAIEDSGKCFLFASYANRICLSMRVSLYPDFCLSSNSSIMTFLFGVVCSILSKVSAPTGGLVFEWGVFMNLPFSSLDLDIRNHDC